MSGKVLERQLPRGVLYEKQEPKKAGIPSGYVFLCNNRTERECLDSRLFGLPESMWSRVSQVKEGDALFLLNYQTNHLHGVFEAVSDGAMNIVPYAYGGRFPAQVRVRRKVNCSWVDKGALLPLIKRRFIQVSRRGILIFPDKLSRNLIDELYRIFLQIPPEFRARTESAYRKARDGHLTRSYGERLVDDWLHEHLPYKHLYDFPLELSGHVIRCDWHVPDMELHIEYWEEPSPRYTDAVDIKLKLYNDHSLKVINLYENDLPSLDHVIRTRIVALMPKCKFKRLARKRKARLTSRGNI